ncbi:MAG: hypothetical protein F4Y91_20815 [Gemmatimonadetes bacterium]|nr:hypothetical protein [Gemmatimonadota bacterium]MXY84426.1 hypothetical protein [Gemmatimonadota bacterium]MYB72143.1 hypothetical protein [Gemmatimonadota bacterium]
MTENVLPFDPKKNGNGDNKVRDYRLDRLEERMQRLEDKTADLKTSVDKLPQALLKWLVPTLISLAVAIFGLLKLWPS